MHTVKASGARSSNAAPKHRSSSTILACRDCVLLFESLIPFSVNSRMMCFTKKLDFGLICPQDVLPKCFLASPGEFSQTPVWLFYVCVSSGDLLGLRH